MTTTKWQKSTIYQPGQVVLHNDQAYVKSDDADQSEPDAIAGGWELIENSNAAEYSAIVESFNTYEARKAAHQKQIKDALVAAGLDPSDVLVTLEAASTKLM
jgi:hypothetical protein